MPPKDDRSPFYGITYNLYRVSPLSNITGITDDDSLKPYARSLRDLIRGNVVRGVQIREPDPEEQREKGYLTRCEWKFVDIPKPQPQFDDDDDDIDKAEAQSAIAITLTYDPPATYHSLLVPDIDDPDAHSNGNYPLLLVRMPKVSREAFTEYLERTFDCHVSQLQIPSAQIKAFLETYLNSKVTVAREMGRDYEVLGYGGDLLINFSGGAAAPYMRTFNATFSREDLPELWNRGFALIEAQEAKKKGKKRKRDEDEKVPEYLFEALKGYFWYVMALRLERLEVTKTGCAGYVLGTSRAKLSAGGEILIRLLLKEALQRFGSARENGA